MLEPQLGNFWMQRSGLGKSLSDVASIHSTCKYAHYHIGLHNRYPGSTPRKEKKRLCVARITYEAFQSYQVVKAPTRTCTVVVASESAIAPSLHANDVPVFGLCSLLSPFDGFHFDARTYEYIRDNALPVCQTPTARKGALRTHPFWGVTVPGWVRQLGRHFT